jgi:hypothetical protein
MSRTVCPGCGEPKKPNARWCAICLDDRLRARPWKKADVERLITAAREMVGAFRVHDAYWTERERVAWVDLVDALDRRQAPTVTSFGEADEAA